MGKTTRVAETIFRLRLSCLFRNDRPGVRKRSEAIISGQSRVRPSLGYDHIGNRQTYGLDANPDTAYTANDLNQYDSTTNPTEVFDYEDDGNLTQDGTFTYAWDAKNRLIEVVPVSPSNDPPRNKKVKFVYDYMGP